MTEQQSDRPELIEKVIKVTRVAKVVKGGRRFSFSALVVVGDGKGRVGYGLGKANEVTEAIRKGVERATKNMKRVVIEGRTIAHPVLVSYGASKLQLNPCPPGSGIIASGSVRAICEAVGIQDISAKSLGSQNPHNVIKATLNGLYKMKSFAEIAERRGMSEEQLRNQIAG